jgi:DNA-binding NarL/FixJ family response regulator
MVVVEEYPLVRAVLRDIVGRHPDIDLIAEAADVDAAVRIVSDETPDVVLVDADPPIAGIVSAVQRLKRECPGTSVVLLGERATDDELFAAIRSGAAAHVAGDAPAGDLVRAIRAAAGGRYVIDDAVAARPAVARHVLEAFREAALLRDAATGDLASAAFAPLSAREAEVLEAIARGNTNRAVGEALGISEQTVKNHVSSILRKLAVNGRTQAVLYALKRSWINIADAPPARPN